MISLHKSRLGVNLSLHSHSMRVNPSVKRLRRAWHQCNAPGKGLDEFNSAVPNAQADSIETAWWSTTHHTLRSFVLVAWRLSESSET